MKYKNIGTSNDQLDEKQLNKLLRSKKRYSTLLHELIKVVDSDFNSDDKLKKVENLIDIAEHSLCQICLLDDEDEQPSNVKGFCKKHYRQYRRQIVPSGKWMPFCSIPGCQNEHSAKGYCALHYSRVITQGLDPNDMVAMHAPKRKYKTRESSKDLGDAQHIE